jgi:hypothetical protein
MKLLNSMLGIGLKNKNQVRFLITFGAFSQLDEGV